MTSPGRCVRTVRKVILDEGGDVPVRHAYAPDAVKIGEPTRAGNRLSLLEQAAVAPRRNSKPLRSGWNNELFQQLIRVRPRRLSNRPSTLRRAATTAPGEESGRRH